MEELEKLTEEINESEISEFEDDVENESDDSLLTTPEKNEVSFDDEIKADELLLDDEFSDIANQINQESESDTFAEDFASYAKGFPDWDLLPPNDDK